MNVGRTKSCKRYRGPCAELNTDHEDNFRGNEAYLHIFLTFALAGGERSAYALAAFIHDKKNSLYPLNRWLAGFQRWTGWFGKEKIYCHLTGVERWSLGRQFLSLITLWGDVSHIMTNHFVTWHILVITGKFGNDEKFYLCEYVTVRYFGRTWGCCLDGVRVRSYQVAESDLRARGAETRCMLTSWH